LTGPADEYIRTQSVVYSQGNAAATEAVGMGRRNKMLKTNQRISKLGLSLGAALLLSGATGSVARANPLPTSSDEARALAASMPTFSTAVRAPEGAITSTDEARALAGGSLPVSSTTPAVSNTVTSTDEARALVGNARLVPVENARRDESRAVASTADHH
jgi:hypothetical protein